MAVGRLFAVAARQVRDRARPRAVYSRGLPLRGLSFRGLSVDGLRRLTFPRARAVPRPDLIVLAAYLAVALAFTFPLVTSLASRIDARFDGIDPLFIRSTLEWERFALLHARDEFFTGNIFFGSGGALFSSDLLLGALPLYVMLRLPFPPVLAFNLLYLVSFFLNAALMYVAVLTILRHRPAAFLAGLIFAFAPLVLHHAMHVQLNFAWWIPLVLLFAIRFARHLRWLDFAIAAALAGIAGVTAVQIGFIAAVVLFAFGLVPGLMLAFRRRVWRPPIFALVAATVVAVPFVPIVFGYLNFAETWGNERTTDQVARLAARIPDYLSPGDRYRWAGFLAERLVRETPERNLLPGSMPIVLAIAGARLGFARGARLRSLTVITLLVAALALVLAFGVSLQWPRFGIDWTLPYSFLFDRFTPLRAIQAAGRFTLLLNFALAILAAVAVHRLASRPAGRFPASRLPAWWLVAVATLLVVVESFPAPLPTTPAPVDDDLVAVLESGSRGPTLILPITREAGLHTRVWSNAQAGNGPLVYGYSGERWPVLDGYDRAIVGMSSAEMDGTVTALRAAGIRRLVIVRDGLGEPDAAAWAGLARHPLVTTVVSSGGVTLYELTGAPPVATSAWSDLDARVLLQVAAPGLRVEAPLVLSNPGPEPWVPAGDAGQRELTLNFRDVNGQAVTSSTVTFIPPPFVPAGATFELSVSLSVPVEPGRFVLTARIDGEDFLSQNVRVAPAATGVATGDLDGSVAGLSAELELVSAREFTVYPSEGIRIRVNALNRGSVSWDDPEIIRAGGRVYRLGMDGERNLLPDEWRIVLNLEPYGPVVPGAGYSFSGRVFSPSEPGDYVLTVGLVAEGVGWIEILPAEIGVTVRAGP